MLIFFSKGEQHVILIENAIYPNDMEHLRDYNDWFTHLNFSMEACVSYSIILEEFSGCCLLDNIVGMANAVSNDCSPTSEQLQISPKFSKDIPNSLSVLVADGVDLHNNFASLSNFLEADDSLLSDCVDDSLFPNMLEDVYYNHGANDLLDLSKSKGDDNSLIPRSNDVSFSAILASLR